MFNAFLFVSAAMIINDESWVVEFPERVGRNHRFTMEISENP
jgi:hypothetical protein